MNNKIKLTEKVTEHIKKISEVAGFLFQREWAESNGGNISVNLTEEFENFAFNYTEYPYFKIDNFPKEVSEKIFFVTGAGERLRELDNPEKTACILKFDKKSEGYYIIWGGESSPDFRPTSELISHIKIHVDLEKRNSNHKVVLHTHPLELICLSHHEITGINQKKFSDACMKMLPEISMVCSKGIGLVPFAPPGSEKLAELTLNSLKENDIVVWSKHGALATGRDINEAFDFIDVANKGAKLYLKCLSAGFMPVGLHIT